MKVLLMVQRLWRGGGTETHVLNLAVELRSLGHHVTIFTAGGPWVAKARKLGVPVHVHSSLRSTSENASKLLRFLHKHQIQLVHAHDGPSLSLAAAALKSTRKLPLVFTVHGPYVSSRAIRTAKQAADAVVAVSPAIRRWLVHAHGVPQPKLFTVENGVPAGVFRPRSKAASRMKYGIPSDAFVIGYAGRFTFDKVLLSTNVSNALKQFASSSAGAYVLIAGRGSKRFAVSSRRVKVLGHVSHMETLYNACDVVVGTARVAAEASLCGVPTIALGKAGFHGFVTRNNLAAMRDSNFGDHGVFHPWSTSTLHRALTTAVRARAELNRSAEAVRLQLQSGLSSKTMVRRILRIYRALK